MKKLIFLFAFPLLICGECENTDTRLKDQSLEHIFDAPTNLPELGKDSISTIDMDGIEGENDPKAVVQVQTLNNQQRIVLWLPVIEEGPHIGNLTLNVTLVADTVQSYSLTAKSAKTPVKKEVDPSPPAPKKDYGKIAKGDNKYKIAKRLGVSSDQILNKEPLKIGEVIRVKQ